MRRRASAVCCAASVLVLTSCVGTGAPDWDLPLTWSQDGTAVTIDEDGRAAVTNVLVGDVSCGSGVAEGDPVTGVGSWAWDDYAQFVVTIDGEEVVVYAAYYRGEPDWTRLLVDPCGPEFPDVDPTELFLQGPYSAVGA